MPARAVTLIGGPAAGQLVAINHGSAIGIPLPDGGRFDYRVEHVRTGEDPGELIYIGVPAAWTIHQTMAVLVDHYAATAKPEPGNPPNWVAVQTVTNSRWEEEMDMANVPHAYRHRRRSSWNMPWEAGRAPDEKP